MKKNKKETTYWHGVKKQCHQSNEERNDQEFDDAFLVTEQKQLQHSQWAHEQTQTVCRSAKITTLKNFQNVNTGIDIRKG